MRHIFTCIVGLSLLCGCEIKEEKQLTMGPPTNVYLKHCAGRHTIDFPWQYELVEGTAGTFKPSGTSGEYSSIAVVISKNGIGPFKFVAEVSRRRAVLKAAVDETTDIFTLERQVASETVLFRINRIDDAYVSEIHFLRGGAFVTATIKSWNREFVNAELVLEKFVQGVQVSGDGQPGAFCLGPVKIFGNFQEETGSYLFRDKVQMGNSFNLDIDTFKPDEKISLLQRMSGSDSLLTKFKSDHKVIRARKISFADMNGEEWLGSIKLGDPVDPKKLQFVLESVRSIPSKIAPYFHLSFETGKTLEDGTVNPVVMPEDEASKQWDTVVSSIKAPPVKKESHKVTEIQLSVHCYIGCANRAFRPVVKKFLMLPTPRN